MSLDLLRKHIFYLLFIGLIGEAAAQEHGPEKYAETIIADNLRKHLMILASDSLGGRGTGQIGQELAAAYLANQFQTIGLLPPVETDSAKSYFQKLTLERTTSAEALIEYKGDRYSTSGHLVSVGEKSIPKLATFRTAFVGRGREDDFANVKVKGKAVVFYAKSSEVRKEIIARAKEKGARIFLVFNNKKPGQFDRFKSRNNSSLSKGSLRLAVPEEDQIVTLIIPPQLAAELVGLDFKQLVAAVDSEKILSDLEIKPKSQSIKIRTNSQTEVILAKNVLGLLPGADVQHEIIVVTAHYDHLGRTQDVVYNGADDDGSGISAILEIARAFVLAAQDGQVPKRSLLFMAVTAEEDGLLGSKFYVENPVIDLENTVVNLNIDMIGRTDDRHDHENYIYIIGSDKLSADLHELSEAVNQKYSKFQFDYRYNDDKDPNRFYYRSDHYNFAKNNIPVIFYFSGVHEDYHRPTDTVDKIQFSKIEKTARLIFHTAWEIANRGNRIKLD